MTAQTSPKTRIPDAPPAKGYLQKISQVTHRALRPLLLGGILLIGGCETVKAPAAQDLPAAPRAKMFVGQIAIAPELGRFGDALGQKLAAAGFHVVPPNEVSAIIQETLKESVLTQSDPGLRALRLKRIDALLFGLVMFPEGERSPWNSELRIISTESTALYAEAKWRNPSSIDGRRWTNEADSLRYKDFDQTVAYLVKQLGETMQQF